MNLMAFLGKPASELLSTSPISGWKPGRFVDNDFSAGDVSYEFEKQGVELSCDSDERIKTIFLRYGCDPTLSDLPFSAGLADAVAMYGEPSKTGEPYTHPVFGESFAWVRWKLDGGTLHVQWKRDEETIGMITLMRADVVPG